MAVKTAQGGDDSAGWPSIVRLPYPGLATGKVTAHPHDGGVFLGDAAAAWTSRARNCLRCGKERAVSVSRSTSSTGCGSPRHRSA